MPGRRCQWRSTTRAKTVIAWNADTGEPVYNAIVWQDNRTQAGG